jgi:O-acetyl-ADP-ribose deacetylase (regulator of RNase III)
VVTSGGNLKARFVIHTVGPVWNGGQQGEEMLLQNAYQNSLKLALQYGVRTIAFPNISTGVYHFPKESAAQIAVQVVRDFQAGDTSLEEIIFCCFDEDNFQWYHKLLNE